ncbi:MAG: hypothetical protein ACRDIZ_06880, partial [Actinomycetota bacterium]
MTPRWALPAGAAGMWAGILIAGEASGAVMGWGLVLGGVVGLTVAVRSGQAARARSRRLMEAAGLEVAAPTPGPRERILLAAGLPTARRPEAAT